MNRLPLIAAWAVLATSLAASPAGASPDDHLLAGAEHFRAGRFDDALIEFRVAEKLGTGGEAEWYVGATLLKLGRNEEALEVFLHAEASAPKVRDAVLDYYFALACYESRLYLAAERLLGAVAGRAGPKIAEQAERARRDIRAIFEKPPARDNVEWYLERGRAVLDQGRARLARAYYEEAQEVARRMDVPHRLDEARSGFDEADRKARFGAKL